MKQGVNNTSFKLGILFMSLLLILIIFQSFSLNENKIQSESNVVLSPQQSKRGQNTDVSKNIVPQFSEGKAGSRLKLSNGISKPVVNDNIIENLPSLDTPETLDMLNMPIPNDENIGQIIEATANMSLAQMAELQKLRQSEIVRQVNGELVSPYEEREKCSSASSCKTVIINKTTGTIVWDGKWKIGYAATGIGQEVFFNN